MNLFIMGDLNNGDLSTLPKMSVHLDDLHKKEVIDKVITFDESGVSYLGAVWAHENDVPIVTIPDHEYEDDIRKTYGLPNRYLRRIVDKYSADAFFFYFIPSGGKDKSVFRRNMRDFYNRSLKAFKSQRIYTNYTVPPA